MAARAATTAAIRIRAFTSLRVLRGWRGARLRPSAGFAMYGNSVGSAASSTLTPSPALRAMYVGPPTSRTAMSVTSSRGRRPLGQPALSPASTVSRFCERAASARRWCPAAPARSSSGHPARTSASVDEVGPAARWRPGPRTQLECQREPRVEVVVEELPFLVRSVAFQSSLSFVPMMTSLISGLASRWTCTQSRRRVEGLPAYGHARPARVGVAAAGSGTRWSASRSGSRSRSSAR